MSAVGPAKVEASLPPSIPSTIGLATVEGLAEEGAKVDLWLKSVFWVPIRG
jgi:hypothetical protein